MFVRPGGIYAQTLAILGEGIQAQLLLPLPRNLAPLIVIGNDDSLIYNNRSILFFPFSCFHLFLAHGIGHSLQPKQHISSISK